MVMKILFHHTAFDAFRKQDAVREELERRGQLIAEAAGGDPDFIVNTNMTKSRVRVTVVTATIDAMEAEATSQVLTRALDAGRG